MKISVKRQTNRATTWKEGANCVNLFLQDRFGNTTLQMGLETTEWGDSKEIKPVVTFSIGGKNYKFTQSELSSKLA